MLFWKFSLLNTLFPFEFHTVPNLNIVANGSEPVNDHESTESLHFLLKNAICIIQIAQIGSDLWGEVIDSECLYFFPFEKYTKFNLIFIRDIQSASCRISLRSIPRYLLFQSFKRNILRFF